MIVSLSVLSFGVIAWAALTRTFYPLSGLLFLIPACGLFFFLDQHLLSAWSFRLTAAWVKKEIDFKSFRQAMEAVPKLPKNTLESMLTILPSSQDLIKEQAIAAATREAISAAIRQTQTSRSDVLAWKAAAAADVSVLIFSAAFAHTWQPLLMIPSLVLLLPA